MTREAWLILGASSSVARAFARLVAADGATLLLAGRDLDDLERSAADLRVRGAARAEVLPFDAADYAAHAAFVERCREAAGPDRRLNVFLAFGAMPDQAEIDAEPALVVDTIAANFTGAASVLHRLAPILEAQQSGRVIALTSVAGDRGRLKNYVYGSAKAGLNAYLQGLRARLYRSGANVTTVKAGFLDTAMTFGLPGLFLVATPEACAAACRRHAAKGRETVYFPFFWLGIMAIIRAIPERIFKRLSI
ncbi:MAG: short-chain dehydrogenase [Alphaproteobacteria bacterium]|nr:MAG: short-chain dehydrogenase [Alphaproteobacteria bacterium]